MPLNLKAFPVQYPRPWSPTTERLGGRGTRRISFFDNYLDRRGTATHHAIDIYGDVRLPILSTTSGRVAKYYFAGDRYRGVDENDGGGKFVVIVDGYGYVHYYAHLSDWVRTLRPEDRVEAGQQIGWLGATGRAGPIPHLHYQVMEPRPDPVNGTDGFMVREAGKTVTNPFTQLATLAKAAPHFLATSLIEADSGLDTRFQNRSGLDIRPRIVLRSPVTAAAAGS